MIVRTVGVNNMGDLGEFWRDVKESSQEYKNKNYTEAYPILNALIDKGIVKAFTPHQFRVKDKLDIYPGSKKYFVLETKEWGKYNNLVKLLKDYLIEY